MGNPILRPSPDPLPLFKGYFVAHVTPHEVGSYPPDVFVRQQRDASRVGGGAVGVVPPTKMLLHRPSKQCSRFKQIWAAKPACAHGRSAPAPQAFTPLVSLEGGTLHPAWAGQRLHWLYGGIGEGGGTPAAADLLLCSQAPCLLQP